MDRDDIRQDKWTEEMTATAVVACVNCGGGGCGVVGFEEVGFEGLHAMDCGEVSFLKGKPGEKRFRGSWWRRDTYVGVGRRRLRPRRPGYGGLLLFE